MKTKKILALILALSLIASPAFANWVNDWIDQKTVSGPSYFHTQKKGYGSFGNYSARWHNPSEPIVTITLPRAPVMGCGGIDMFLGGFTFLKADYIVDKLKKMMGPAAAAFAYGIAMGSLNAQAKSVLDGLQKTIDDLNSLQLNECSVSTRAMEIGQALGKQYGEPFVKKAASALTESMSGLGAVENWYKSTKENVNKKLSDITQGAGIIMDDVAGDCPNDITDIFLTDGSILNNIGGILGYSQEQIRLIRGLVGDVTITTSVVPVTYTNLDKCPENRATATLNNIVTGNYFTRNNPTLNTTCTKATGLNIGGVPYDNIQDWINNSLVGIGNKIIAQEEITDLGQKELLNRIPTPLLSAIATSIHGSDTPSQENINTAGMYAPYVSSMFVYNMVQDLYAGIELSLSNVKRIRERHNGTTNPSAQCPWESIDEAILKLERLEDNLTKLTENLYKEFGTEATSLSTQLAVNDNIRNMSMRLKAKVRDMLGNQIAKTM